MKKWIAIVLCATLLLFVTPAAFALDTEVKCISYKTYEEITDTDGLIQLALSQSAGQPRTLSKNEADSQLTSLQAKQLLEEKVYSDGVVEKVYASTAIQRLAVANGAYDESSSAFDYGVTLMNTINYSTRIVLGEVQCRINFIRTTVTCSTTNAVQPTNGNHYCDPSGSNPQWGFFTFNTINGVQSWQMASTDSNYYNLGNGGPYMELFSQSSINLTNGSSLVAINHLA